jgi:hypothetical protein
MPLPQDRAYLLAYVARLEVNATRDEKNADEEAATRERLSELLTGVANAFKGEPPELTSWSWHDLPELAEKIVTRLGYMASEAKARTSEGEREECMWIARDVERLLKELRPDED